MTLLLLVIVLAAVIYVALSLPSVQNSIRLKCEERLSQQLGVEVNIGDLGIRPFNKATLRNVSIVNHGDTIAKCTRLGAGINLYELITHRNIAFDYGEISGLDLRLNRPTPDAPLNIQPLIDALNKKDKNKPPTKFDLRINTVVIRQSSVSYNVLSAPRKEPGEFDPSHISVTDLRADISIPRLSNEEYIVNLRRMAFTEQSGLDITDMHAALQFSNTMVGWTDMVIEMPGSKIEPYDLSESPTSLGSIAMGLNDDKLSIGLKPGSHIYLPDLAPFLPELRDIRSTVDLRADIAASPNRVDINNITLADRSGELALTLAKGTVNNPLSPQSMSYNVENLSARIGGKLYSQLAQTRITPLQKLNLPHGINLSGEARGNIHSGEASMKADISNGEMIAGIAYVKPDSSPLRVRFEIFAKNIDLNEALGREDLGLLNATIDGESMIAGRNIRAKLNATVDDFTYRGYQYGHISAQGDYNGGAYTGDIIFNDAGGDITATFNGNLTRGKESIIFKAILDNVDLNRLNLTDKYAGYTLTSEISGDLKGVFPDRADGIVEVNGLTFKSEEGKCLALDNITVHSKASELPRHIEIDSDILNGDIEGDFKIATLIPKLREMALTAFPTLQPDKKEVSSGSSLSGANKSKGRGKSGTQTEADDFDYSFTLDHLDNISDFFNLPVYAIYPIEISGNVDSRNALATLNLDAPYLRQGNKLIEGTQINTLIDGNEGTDRININTSYPSKDGMTAITVALQARDNVVDTDINWKIDRARDYSGSVSLSTLIDRRDGQLNTYTDLHPSTMTFNDSVWVISPALIASEGMSRFTIDDFNVSRQNQFVKMEGVVSADPEGKLDIDVLNLNIDYIFEAVGIDKVMIGGDATGQLSASHLLSAEPHISTEGIHVTNISYNHCVLGDADVISWWDNEIKAVAIDGTIHQENGKTAKVEGEIFPLSSSLDIRLKPDETPVGFMEEYMKAFASDISGYGSGYARVYGTFSDIDMEGDLYVKDLRLKLDFTNTYFTASDSIKITPGKINLTDVTLSDPYGNTAKLNGTVTHEFFRTPTFNFAITDARGMLVYDETPKQNADWYGRIFVNGGATIQGEPGVVKIDVEATTTAGSTFSFVLSELEIADEYTFLTFRNKDEKEVGEEIIIDERMGAVEHLRQLLNKPVDEETSDYIIELRVNITPEAEVILVMDPVGGDRIRSHGQGNMRMVYTSADNDLRMFGTYTLDRGTYNFTLQDIIIKDFIINSGSSIAFTGDPLTARLNIEAIYQLNANLSDLDESFLQDKELNRTNVPVQAVLKVTGDIQQPEIRFDLAFPTLTSDTYRKVRSIVSTEEMMNRQIIYLLALNRFYTPDYMASTTKGNELFSVASSTISSQLSNILGHLSDNWSVSPNFRSDRGDFSDMEVDVALSSRLLNNRLIFNGNLGYRDNLMNSNQFIGDFQIEYLLNRTGTIRLKAYNFYNDQNYYLRTADTTQGVGVMFKKDFDNIFSFLRRKKKSTGTEPADTAVKDVEDSKPENQAETTPRIPEDNATKTGTDSISKVSTDSILKAVTDTVPPGVTPAPLLQFKSKENK